MFWANVNVLAAICSFWPKRRRFGQNLSVWAKKSFIFWQKFQILAKKTFFSQIIKF
jgi:hypothetical protein